MVTAVSHVQLCPNKDTSPKNSHTTSFVLFKHSSFKSPISIVILTVIDSK